MAQALLTSAILEARTEVRTAPILFLHIPKTAGTSFLTALRNLFGDRRVRRITGTEMGRREQVAALTTPDLAPLSVVAGHIPRHVWQPHLPRLRPFTMLRDPVTRVCSLYRFLRHAPPEALAQLGLEVGFSLEQFLTTRAPGTFSQLHNGMARMLSGTPALNDPDAPAFWSEEAMAATLADTEAFLADAVFGLAEHMPDSLRLLQHAWELPYPIAEYNENATRPDDSPISVDDLHQIVACNGVDIALYHAARRMFLTRLRALTPRTLPPTQGMWHPILGIETRIDDICGRQGFHDFEPIGFAWAMQRPTPQIHFRPPEGGVGHALRIELHVYMINPVYQAEDFCVQVDDIAQSCTIAWRKGHWAMLVVGPLILADGCHHLTIEPGFDLSVRELDPSSHDPRHLSFALASVRFSSKLE
jgi:hypothetical protein